MFWPDGQVTSSKQSFPLKGFWKNKLMYADASNNPPESMITRVCSHQTLFCHEKLFVDPKSGLSRDLLRNSGYSITINKDKADCIVVPYINNNAFASLEGQFVFTTNSDNILYLVSVIKRGSRYEHYTELSEKDFNRVIGHINNFVPEEDRECFLYNSLHTNINVWFIPNIESYKEILSSNFWDNNVMTGRRYIFDSRVTINAPVKIDIETLQLWSHNNDNLILEKSVINSDWKKYPLTMCFFMSNIKRILGPTNNYNLALIRDAIGYNEYISHNYNRVINPEDWNLLQKFLLAQFGLYDQDKGFVDNFAKSIQLNMIRSKIAVSALYIDKPTFYPDLIAQVKS